MRMNVLENPSITFVENKVMPAGQHILNDSKTAAKWLATAEQLEMFYEKNTPSGVCNHAVAVVAAVSAVVAAASSVIAASTRGMPTDVSAPQNHENSEFSKLNLKELLELREARL